MKFLRIICVNCLICQLFLFSSCNNDSPNIENPADQNIIKAGNNKVELEKAIAHFSRDPADSLKLKAIKVLIGNIESSYHYGGEWLEKFDIVFDKTFQKPEKEIKRIVDSLAGYIGWAEPENLKYKNDLLILDADYLIENVEHAVNTWQNSPWGDSISFYNFCNFILPYHNYSEYPESWRASLNERYNWIVQDTNTNKNLQQATIAFNKDLLTWFRYTGQFEDYPGRISIKNLMKGGVGNCSDMASVAAYIGRSIGLPIAIEYMPQWGSGNGGHVWNALILNENKSIPFLGAEGQPGTYTTMLDGEGRIAKVYRRLLTRNKNSFAFQANEKGLSYGKIPRYAMDLRTIDVTHLYSPVADLSFALNKTKEKAVYLAVFNNGSWEAIIGSVIDRNGKVHFKNMGRSLLYLPSFYNNEKYTYAREPFILDFEGKPKWLKITPDQTQHMVLKRKSPLSRHLTKWGFANSLDGAVFEGSNTPDFRKVTVLHTIGEAMKKWTVAQTGGVKERDQMQYETLWEEVDLDLSSSFQYVRIRTRVGARFRLGDLQFFGENKNEPLSGNPIGSIQNPEWAFDGTDGHSIIYDEPLEDSWVGLDLGKAQKIGKIKFIPGQDNNRILKGKTYDFLYWDNGWRVFGTQRAEQFSLSFDGVPQNTLYRIRCKDCESGPSRPFTYENGRQYWY